MFRSGGKRTRRLVSYLRRRAGAEAARRPEMDCRSFPDLFRKRAVVFTDTADFTVRTARDGILHFLMLFERLVPEARRGVARAHGEIVKVEADSFLLRFPDAVSACRGIDAMEATLRRLNRGRPENERLRFGYGVGFGDVLDLEHDLFGLEVNLASKLGEDLARPGEALLTPAAAAALDARTLTRVSLYRTVTFDNHAIAIQRLRLR
jgi:class 3 adenylate cyclase